MATTKRRRIVRTAVACTLGLVLGLALALGLYVASFQRRWGLAVLAKAAGRYEPCPWPALARYPLMLFRFADLKKEYDRVLSVEREDRRLGIQLIRTPGRSFWIKKDGELMNGTETLAYLLAEQQWIGEAGASFMVKPGDVVLDVGAHIGTFDDEALRRGASRCILIEPDPVNVECIRRNFPDEIAAGKIVVVSEGAWSSTSTLEFLVSASDSAMGTFVLSAPGAGKITVPVRPLDEMVAGLGLDRVNYIAMDIEGAEREALKGARDILRRWRPTIMLASYHRPDDDVVLPGVIRAANSAYQGTCVLCSQDPIRPHIVFYR